jgi:hypothetical protein
LTGLKKYKMMMETVKKTKATDKTKKEMAAQPKKLSPAGEWMRKHPLGLKGVVINDRSILYN